jgi:hypothetical protein
MLCKFLYKFKKKFGKHCPSQLIMQLYKGFNQIVCQVQKDCIYSTVMNEPDFIMHHHLFFGHVDKSIILAMRKNIKVGINMCC